MHFIQKYNLIKIRFIILLLLKFFIVDNKYFLESFEKEKIFINLKQSFKILSVKEIFNINIPNATVLIFEPNKHHHECIPGYTKYFIDLGYNVDILIHSSGLDSLMKFEKSENIRLFIFNDLFAIYLYIKVLCSIIRKYTFVLVQTVDANKLDLYKGLNLLKLNNSAFVFHDLNIIDINYFHFFKENRIWTLGNFSKGLQVNPHFFGNISIKDKNNKVIFFMTSTYNRNYKYLIESSARLKNENFNFEIIITGRSSQIKSYSIPENIKDIFIFKKKVTYYEMYKIIQSSDFIIIPLKTNWKNDYEYKTNKVTGSIQIVYGFLKPAIIHREFAKFYNLNDRNSLIFNNTNFYDIMKKSILLNNNHYKNLQHNLQIVEKNLYQSSINNIKKTCHLF